ncbi:unnamed protein product [Paramecium octaurelia]|uniref:Tricarboxylate transport protein n=1 Tax=Paramecium octaurelia TaxID=43137 RepID=A0A8S1U3W4_PAROT|nr:unnamed protein product [Paramecium octaurelia]
MGGAKVDSKDPVRGIISGGITGGIEICITYPTEYIKTMMQLYKEYSQKGVKYCIGETYKNFGITGFYRGLTPLVTFSIPKVACRFGANEWLKNNVFTDRKSRLQTFFAGLGAGVFEAVVVVTPTETLKVKLIHDKLSTTPKYRGMIHGIGSIVNEMGLSGIYKGLVPTILKQGSNQGIRFVVFEDTKKLIQKTFTFLPEPVILLLSGGVAGAASVMCNTPVDVIKTQMQGLKAHEYNGVLDCCKQTYQHEGVRGFYKGTVPRLGRVVLDVAITFTLYDYIGRVLNLVWPPKH